MRLLRITGLCALLVGSAGACADLTQPNTNQPDQSRVIASAGDVEALVAGSYLTLFRGYTWQTDLVLSTTAFQHSTTAASFGTVQLSRLPREPINNTTSDAYTSMYEEIWYNSYAAIKAAVDGLNATHPLNPDGFRIIDEQTDADNTPRARAWARFTQGLGHGLLALTYDQAFVYDQGVDPVKLTLQPYNEVMTEALAQLDSAAALAAANDFTIPATWFGNVGMTRATFIRTINGYQAFLRASVARTPAQRNAVNWAAVIADVDASFPCPGSATCENLTIDADPSVWIHGTHYYMGFAMQSGAWAQVSNFVHGMADQSGGYQTWLNKQVLSRTPFLIVTPDLRFPQGATATAQAQNPGRYLLYGGTRGHLRSDRGTWRWSMYRDYRLDNTPGDQGPSILLSGRDLRLLKAEGLFRAGQLQAAADIINETRVHNGLSAATAAGLNTSCVPRLPGGQCGGLFEMLKWEKRMENYHHNFGAWYFDSRGWGDLYRGTFLHFPVPARELQVLGLPLYTFGGPGGYSNGTSPGSNYAYSRE
ncbi:hypothetical protein [Longimicrobium sp.]|uniref:hypothetical protein n=1 Tax=Longimicrobium sp. TaxID=2029185 RepID=UPI003B3AD3C2